MLIVAGFLFGLLVGVLLASRTPHTGAALEVLTAANLAKYPKGWLGYADDAGPITVNTSEDSVVSVSVTTGSSRLIKITARGSVLDGDNNSTGGTFRIERDGTDLGRVHRHPDTAEISFIAGYVLDTPSSGAHTYALVGETDSNDMTAASNSLIVEDVGPSS